MGYWRAGFDVTGVDIEPHPDYPFRLIEADAMDLLAHPLFLDSWDAIHASPPCPRFSDMTNHATRHLHPDLLTPTLAALRAWDGPWIVENVPPAGRIMGDAVLVCGRAMGLPGIKRHRLFASNQPLMSPGCGCGVGQAPWGIYGDHGDGGRAWVRPGGGTGRGRKAHDTAHAQALLGINWMTRWADLADAIPPAFTEYLGGQLIDTLAA